MFNKQHHLPEPTPSLGPSSSFGDNFSAAWEQQYRVDSMLSMESELANRWNDNLEEVQKLTGEDLTIGGGNELDVLGLAARRELGAQLDSFATPRELVPFLLERFEKSNKRLQELKKQYPQLQSFPEILQDVQKFREEVSQDTAETGERAGWAGTLGSFLGGMAGSFSQRDPLLVGSMFFGGWGQTIAKRVLTEGIVGAGAETAQQYGFVQPTRDVLGEQRTNPLYPILLAGAGGAVLRGAVEAPGPIYRSLERKVAPQRAAARIVSEQVDETVALMDYIETLPDSPTKRAATYALEGQEELRTNNNYGQNRVSDQRLLQDMEEVAAMFDGRTETAVSNQMDLNTPAYLRDIDFDQAKMRAEDPVLMDRYDQSLRELEDIELRINEATNEIDSREVSDAVELIDEPSAARIREIENELTETVPAARRRELEDELETVLSNFDEESIAQAEQNFRSGARRNIRSLRASRKRAKRDFNRVNNEVQQRIDNMNARDRAEFNVRERMAARNTDIPRGQRGAEPDPEAITLSEERVKAFATRVDESAQEVDEISQGLVRAESEEGVDVGLEEPVAENLAVPQEVLENGKVQTMTARRIMDDLKEDDDMLEAMRSCSL